ncbi:MAG: hypothetical protein IJR63_04965 [Synergistaceae bacterium]|nr:hypothetical protein [Synergistaceae bacterium]
MKKAVAAGLVLAEVLAVTGTSFAEIRENFAVWDKGRKVASTQPARPRPPEPPDTISSKRPPMSRDVRRPDDRPPMPPDDRHPRISPDKRPPMPPRSGDRRPPEFDRNQPRR